MLQFQSCGVLAAVVAAIIKASSQVGDASSRPSMRRCIGEVAGEPLAACALFSFHHPSSYAQPR
jgi:hypothetical protein